MRSLEKKYLGLDEELYRVLTTMVKKMKLSKKDDKLIFTETVSEILWLKQIMQFQPVKYGIMINQEEAAKIIYYYQSGSLVFHDLYVNPKYRKQGVAKALITEVLMDNRSIPTLEFHARDTNKPVRNLTSFFIAQYQLPQDGYQIQVVPTFYVDGGKAVIYKVINPAYFWDRKDHTHGEDHSTPSRDIPESDGPSGVGTEIQIQGEEPGELEVPSGT